MFTLQRCTENGLSVVGDACELNSLLKEQMTVNNGRNLTQSFLARLLAGMPRIRAAAHRLLCVCVCHLNLVKYIGSYKKFSLTGLRWDQVSVQSIPETVVQRPPEPHFVKVYASHKVQIEIWARSQSYASAGRKWNLNFILTFLYRYLKYLDHRPRPMTYLLLLYS